MGDAMEAAIAGLPSARLWPFVRPVDGVASNSYVLSVGPLFMVIDPGADTAQTRRILDLLEQERAPSAPPVLLMLTHCHRDHSLFTFWLMSSGLPLLKAAIRMPLWLFFMMKQRLMWMSRFRCRFPLPPDKTASSGFQNR